MKKLAKGGGKKKEKKQWNPPASSSDKPKKEKKAEVGDALRDTTQHNITRSTTQWLSNGVNTAVVGRGTGVTRDDTERHNKNNMAQSPMA